jgi:nicotinamidase-related amidase
MPVANRGTAMPNIRRLMTWARLEQVPIISSLEAHRMGESPNGLPPHCIDRSPGQRKLPFTLMPRRILVMGDNTTDLPSDAFRRFQQVILTKRNVDFLTNPKADRLINSVGVDHFIIFGISAAHCVKAMVLGLIAQHNHVVVVTDACGWWSQGDADHSFRQMDAKGAVLVTTEELVSGAADERIRTQRPLHVLEMSERTAYEDTARDEELGRTSRSMTRRRTPARPGDASPRAANGHGKANGNGGNGHVSSEAEKKVHRPNNIPELPAMRARRSRRGAPDSASRQRRGLA